MNLLYEVDDIEEYGLRKEKSKETGTLIELIELIELIILLLTYKILSIKQLRIILKTFFSNLCNRVTIS